MNITRLSLLIWLLGMGCLSKIQDRNAIPQTSPDVDHSFETFFAKFSVDSNFQSSRIIFPLKYSFYDSVNDVVVETETTSVQWRYVDFTKDSLAEKKEAAAYSIETVKKGTSNAEYKIRGIDNGIMKSYIFEMKASHWFLVEIQNRST